jgi:hypothetical protein
VIHTRHDCRIDFEPIVFRARTAKPPCEPEVPLKTSGRVDLALFSLRLLAPPRCSEVQLPLGGELVEHDIDAAVTYAEQLISDVELSRSRGR